MHAVVHKKKPTWPALLWIDMP